MATDRDARLEGELRAIAEPLTAREGVELVDVEVRGHRGSRVVRLVVDADEGVDVERIAAVSRAVGAALDEDDLVAGRYTLQVTSPGADRPLRTSRDFARNVGRPVRLVATGVPGDVTGTVVAVDDLEVTLEIDGEPTALLLADVDHAKVQLPW